MYLQTSFSIKTIIDTAHKEADVDSPGQVDFAVGLVDFILHLDSTFTFNNVRYIYLKIKILTNSSKTVEASVKPLLK